MNIKKIVSVEMDQNCYLLEKDGKGILIDPGMDTEKIIRETEGIEINYILLTHCHFDHLYSLNEIRGSKKVVGTAETSENMILQNISLCDLISAPRASCDIEIEDGEERDFNGIKIKCIKTPGHTNGSVCYLADNCLFSGDTIFHLSIGRCDLPTGNFTYIENSIKNKIYTLSDDTVIYPGHGKETTVGFEKKNNLYVRE